MADKYEILSDQGNVVVPLREENDTATVQS